MSDYGQRLRDCEESPSLGLEGGLAGSRSQEYLQKIVKEKRLRSNSKPAAPYACRYICS